MTTRESGKTNDNAIATNLENLVLLSISTVLSFGKELQNYRTVQCLRQKLMDFFNSLQLARYQTLG